MSKEAKKIHNVLGVKLSEFSTVRDKVQLLKVCNFTHPAYGKVVITKKTLSELVKSHENNVRGVKLMIDYGHNSEGEAAGWINRVFTENSGSELWADVEWTKSGEIALSEKKYGYLSADYEENYVDNENPDITHPFVLKGAGLTNRPVIKRMAPAILLSENAGDGEKAKDLVVFEEKQVAPDEMPNDGVGGENEKEIEVEIELACEKDHMQFTEADKADLIKLLKMMGVGSVQEGMQKYQEKNKEQINDVKPIQFAEVKNMEKTELEKELEGKIAAQEAELAKYKEKEKVQSFDLMLSEGKVVEAQREAFIANDMAEFAKNAQPIKLAETGGAGNKPEGEDLEKDAEVEIKQLAETAMKENDKLNYPEAVSLVLSENKALAQKYNKKFNEEGAE